MACTAALYSGVAISEAVKGNAPMAVVFGAYALGNLGFIWGMLK